jgi:hypothetical protein
MKMVELFGVPISGVTVAIVSIIVFIFLFGTWVGMKQEQENQRKIDECNKLLDDFFQLHKPNPITGKHDKTDARK